MPLHAPIQWFGGKGNMLAKLVPLVPPGGRPYVEPYMGAASLFFARDPAPVEVLNDLNGDLVHLFRCLQDRTMFDDLRHRLMWTPYARAEFCRALDLLAHGTDDPVLRAWAFFVVHNQGVSGELRSPGGWSRSLHTTYGGMAHTTNRWLMRLSMLDAWHWRLMRVQLDQRDALEVIRYWDTPDTVFYCDPPYHPETLADDRGYSVRPDAAHHVALVATLLACQGAVVLSGYAHADYRPLTDAGWECVSFETACHAAVRGRGSGLQGLGAARAKVPRVEVVWRNPRAVALTQGRRAVRPSARNGQPTLPLFAEETST